MYKPNVTFNDASTEAFRKPALVKAAIALSLRLYSRPSTVYSVVFVNNCLSCLWCDNSKKSHLMHSLSNDLMRMLKSFNAL